MSPLTTTAFTIRGFLQALSAFLSGSTRCGVLGAPARPGQRCRRSGAKPLKWELEAIWETFRTLGLVQCPWITPHIGTPPIGTGRRRPYAARPLAHRYFSIDLRWEIRSNTGDSIRNVCAGRHAVGTGAMLLRGRLAGWPSSMIEEGEGIADHGAYTSIPSALLSSSTR